MPSDEKYIVIRREEWNAFISRIPDDALPAIDHTPPTLDDAVVIRTQDVFAYSGLAAYANTIRTHMALLELHVGDDAGPMVKRLEEIAGYFEGCAQEAEDRIARGEVKVPD